VRYVGATPVFAEVQAATFNLDPDAAAAAITTRTRAILVVHQIGLPADLDAFRHLAERHGLLLLEDAACAIGAKFKDERIGGESAMACFSFHPRKVITTGEGGMITTNDAALAQRLRTLRQHAMSLSDAARHQARQVVFEEYPELGFNYRMTDVQAAIGVEQMKRLDGILVRRRELADRYAHALSGVRGVEVPWAPVWATPNYQSYAVRLTPEFPLSRGDLMNALLARGIASRRGIMAIHRERAYPHQAPLPITEHAADHSLLIPLFPQMTEGEQDRVVHAFRELAGHRYAAA
jgi:dTDP-4-amino-4,6-dideoxygalactose transaminase